jgi:hypothetical protein
MTKKNSTALTLTEMAALCARGARIHCGHASLQVLRIPLVGTAGQGEGETPTERRFVMEGPSGRHSLLVEATDLERLNAHWTVFCADRRNVYAAA